MILSLTGPPVQNNSCFPLSPSAVILYKYHLPTELQILGKSKPIASLGKDDKHSSKEEITEFTLNLSASSLNTRQTMFFLKTQTKVAYITS